MEAKPQVLVSVGFHGYVGAVFQLETFWSVSTETLQGM